MTDQTDINDDDADDSEPTDAAEPGADSEEVAPEDVPFREVVRTLLQASRGFWLVNWINFADGVAYFGFMALMTLFMENNVGFTTEWSTRSIGVFTAGVTIFMAVGGGSLSDWLGVRRALTLAVGAILVGRIMLTGSPHMGGGMAIGATAWLSLLIMAFGEGILQPALYAGVKEYTDRRTATMGYAVLYSIMNLGIVAGSALSPQVRALWAERVDNLDTSEVPTAGISGAFWFFVVVTAVMLAVHVIFFTRKVELRDRMVVDSEPEPTDKRSWADKLRELPLLADPRFMFFIFILLPVRTLFAHQFLTLPLYVTRAYPPAAGAHWEWLYGINPLVIVIFVPLLAALTRKQRVVDMMIAGTMVSALAPFLLTGGPSLTMLIIYLIIWSFGEAMWSSRFLEYVAELAPPNKIGIYMGVAGIPWFAAKLVTSIYAGSMVNHFVPAASVNMETLGGMVTKLEYIAPTQSSGTMWALNGTIALVSPVALILARGWLLRAERKPA